MHAVKVTKKNVCEYKTLASGGKMSQDNLLPKYYLKQSPISGEMVITEKSIDKTELPFESELPADHTLPNDMPAIPKPKQTMPANEFENAFAEDDEYDGYSRAPEHDMDANIAQPPRFGPRPGPGPRPPGPRPGPGPRPPGPRPGPGPRPPGPRPPGPGPRPPGPRPPGPRPPGPWRPTPRPRPPYWRLPIYPIVPFPPIFERPPNIPSESVQAIELSTALHSELRTLEWYYQQLYNLTSQPSTLDAIEDLMQQTRAMVYSSGQIYTSLTGRQPPPYYDRSELPRNFNRAVERIDLYITQIKQTTMSLQRLIDVPSINNELSFMHATLNNQQDTLRSFPFLTLAKRR